MNDNASKKTYRSLFGAMTSVFVLAGLPGGVGRDAWKAPWRAPTATIPTSMPSAPRSARPTKTCPGQVRLSPAGQRHRRRRPDLSRNPTPAGRAHAIRRAAPHAVARAASASRSTRTSSTASGPTNSVRAGRIRRPRRPRDPAQQRAEHPVRRRVGLHERPARHGHSRPAAQQRRGHRGAAAPDPATASTSAR